MQMFNVQDWIENDNSDFIPITQPQAVGCWTKESINEGGKYYYGSTKGEPDDKGIAGINTEHLNLLA